MRTELTHESDAIDDVLIIGGGPAGLAAALPLGRMRRSVRLFDGGTYRNAPAVHIQNLPTWDGQPPAAYRAAARAELAHYPTVTIADVGVSAVTRDATGFAVTLADGAVRRGRRLLLATGVTDTLPPIPGLADLWGTVVAHCHYCHGYEVRDQPLALLVSSHAPLLARVLRRLSPDVTLLLNGDETTVAAADLAALAAAGIAIRPEPITRVEATGAGATVHFATGAPLFRRAIFVKPELTQHAPFASDLGCELSDMGGVVVDAMQKTTVDGVWAAGDMAHPTHLPMAPQAVAFAIAGGLMAGTAIDMDLLTSAIATDAPAGPSATTAAAVSEATPVAATADAA